MIIVTVMVHFMCKSQEKVPHTVLLQKLNFLKENSEASVKHYKINLKGQKTQSVFLLLFLDARNCCEISVLASKCNRFPNLNEI